MVLTILITFISLIGLIILHEFGHFVLAKKFGVKVEEFGIGIPPRIFGKKIGETIYSINLLPFGAFVKILGEDAQRPEEERLDDPRSFNKKPIWQRALIVLAGVFSFWLISFLIFSFLPTGVTVSLIRENSPAAISGLVEGDIIEEVKVDNREYSIFKIEEAQRIINQNRGKEINLIILRGRSASRGKEKKEISVTPRISPPAGEGALGIGLSYGPSQRNYPFYQIPLKGFLRMTEFTFEVIKGWISAISDILKGKPANVQVMGPVGIFSLSAEILKLGGRYFLLFLALISIYVALFNILPIPALDGGKLLFLGIEAVRKKPISQETEKKITGFFFAILVLLMVFLTIKDITKLF
jgi:regulator of sigma E protease